MKSRRSAACTDSLPRALAAEHGARGGPPAAVSEAHREGIGGGPGADAIQEAHRHVDSPVLPPPRDDRLLLPPRDDRLPSYAELAEAKREHGDVSGPLAVPTCGGNNVTSDPGSDVSLERRVLCVKSGLSKRSRLEVASTACTISLPHAGDGSLTAATGTLAGPSQTEEADLRGVRPSIGIVMRRRITGKRKPSAEPPGPREAPSTTCSRNSSSRGCPTSGLQSPLARDQFGMQSGAEARGVGSGDVECTPSSSECLMLSSIGVKEPFRDAVARGEMNTVKSTSSRSTYPRAGYAAGGHAATQIGAAAAASNTPTESGV